MLEPVTLVWILMILLSSVEPSLGSSQEPIPEAMQTGTRRADRTGRVIKEPHRCEYSVLETMYEAWEGHNELLLKGPWPKGYVTVFFDAEIHCRSQWIFNFTSNVWKYMQATYGNFGPSPELHIVIHEQQLPGSRHMYSLNQHGSPPKPNILDLGHLTPRYWTGNLTRNESQDLIANKLAYFVEFSSKNRSGSPSYNVWKYPNSEDTAWVDIFTYDVYKTLNFTIQNNSQAQRYKEERELISYDFPRNDTFWFRDWFLPIYEIYGENAVLKRYFQYLHDSLSVKHSLTMGEFVHFWSAAAGSDLKSLAENAFGWNEIFEEELDRAREKYDKLTLSYNFTRETTTTTEKVQSSTSKESSENQGQTEEKNVIIFASAGAGILALIILFVVAVILFRKKIHNLKTEIRSLTAQEVREFFEGDPNIENDSDEHQTLIESMPFIQDYEIPKDQIILAHDKVIGTGQFGYVLHGFVRIMEDDELIPVAVKMVRKNVDVNYFKAFLSEVKIMAYLGKHENIVDLIGTCTRNIKEREIFIALELCPLGNLEDYLKNNRQIFQVHKHFENSLECVTIDLEESHSSRLGESGLFTSLDLLRWSHNISNAMIYLTQKKVIHGDLAARNVLLTAEREAKICDFGLSRQYLNYANYTKESKTPVPWRWLAIECMKELKFSTASDIWAYGVLIWEIFSLGETPYGCYAYDLQFADRLLNGERLLRPNHANFETYQLMLDCWKVIPTERPAFQQIFNTLGRIISKIIKNCLNPDGECDSNTSTIISS